MCGIAGILGHTVGNGEISRMLKTMARRGPDGSGIYSAPGVTLLHTRLAVIDLAGGGQPMKLHWNGEDYVLTYNGELYNTQELRSELQGRGHHFLGHSDTEIVLHAYAEFGPGCVEYFNGIFAFGVWEERRGRLFLARDRIGVKPLFFSRQREGLVFASEIKTILASALVKPRLDADGAAQLILLGPGRKPGSGVFRDIRELEPGCAALWEQGAFSEYRYWKLRDREHRESFPETVQQVRYLVTDAIRRQLVADVPVGTFLSGGLDSSIITAISAWELREKGEILHTFSVDYENNDLFFRANKFQPDSDGAYIRLMQQHLQTRHRETMLNPENLIAVLQEATIARDLPGMADVDFSLMAFCKDIREDVKVALSGECADEIFGGYPWYRDPEVRAREGFPWAQNTLQRVNLLRPGICPEGEAYVMEQYACTCRESDILPETKGTERRMKEMVNLNFRWFMQTLLDRKDRMSMYHSLEVRVPFCDYRIAEYLYGIPWEMKDWQGREKGLLRCAMEGLLPEQVLYRKKSPYPKICDPEFSRLVQQQYDALLERDCLLWYIADKEEAAKIREGEMLWPWYGQLMRRTQTQVYLLQMDFWLRQYQVECCF